MAQTRIARRGDRMPASLLARAGGFAADLGRSCASDDDDAIGFVKHGFLLVRRFRNRADLEAQLVEWLTFVNEARPCDATGVIPAVRLAEERARLHCHRRC